MNQLMRVLLSVACLCAMIVVSPRASAPAGQPTRALVEAIESVCYIQEPGTSWTSADGILHIRGQVRKDRVVPRAGFPEPRVDAWAYLTADVDVDLATGKGRLHGSLLVDPVDETLGGDFQGRFTGEIFNGWAIGTAVAQGTGAFTGLKLSGTFKEFPSTATNDQCGVDRVFPDRQTHVTGTITEANDH